MNEVLLLIFSLSISGSVIAILMLLLKPFIKDTFSKTWQYYVYLIIIFRLLIPFSPETSIIGGIFTQVGSQFTTQNIEISGEVTENEISKILPAEDNYQTALDNTMGSVLSTVLDNLWIIWISAAFVLFMRKILIYHGFIRFVKTGCYEMDNNNILRTYQQLCAELKIKKPPAVYKNNMVSTPMLVGIIRPFIVIPDIELKTKEMRYIFQHELTHYKRLDIFYKWLVQAAVCLHWFNPLVYRISKEINSNCELSCDEAIISRLDKKEKYFYGDTLLAAINPNHKHYNHVASISLNENTKLIKERLESIMKHKTASKKIFISSLILAAVILCGAIFAGCYASNDVITITDEMKTPATVSDISYLPISNEQQLKAIGTGEYALDKSYMLIGDIVLTGEWTSIGNKDNPFTGVFQGNGFKIEMPSDPNVKLSALFDYLENAEISNLTIKIPENSIYEDGEYVGIVANYSNDSQIYDISVIGTPASAGSESRTAESPKPLESPQIEAVQLLMEKTFIEQGIVIMNYGDDGGVIIIDAYIKRKDGNTLVNYDTAVIKVRECLDILQDNGYIFQEYSGVILDDNEDYTFQIIITAKQ